MKISYSMLVHNETDTLEKLLKFLIKWKDPNDEIVIKSILLYIVPGVPPPLINPRVAFAQAIACSVE